MTLLDRLRSHRTDMTTREREVAHYLESGYPHAGLQSATAVAERVGVSAATIVRFIAKLGYDGYAEFQRELREEVGARLASPLQRLETPQTIEPGSGAGDVVSRSFDAALASMTRTYGAFDRRALDLAADALAGCKGRIWIIGEKKGRSVALYLYAHLNLCLPRVTLLSTDGSFAADTLLDVGPDDVAILVGMRRYVGEGIIAAKWCQSRGARLIVLSDSTTAPVFEQDCIRLVATSSSAGAFDSYVGLMLVADILTNAVTELNPDQVRARLSIGERAWGEFNVFTAQPEAQPDDQG
jgi:DNA-binding MurR/RpiR family transcriptional regulator